ncbi:MAG: response regulator, partial [Candidatus Aminicenantes bacterium]|nr:response regulator [Candidatus Aminicenantes bacterium]
MYRLLVVDDEATITTQLEERLTRLGYDIVGSASCAEEALAMARKYRPDLILMDIVMPGEMDGIDAAAIITRELDIPVVFLTAYGDERYINRAKQSEALGYIIKPYQVEGLKA